MKRKIVNQIIVFALVTSFVGTSSVYAAEIDKNPQANIESATENNKDVKPEGEDSNETEIPSEPGATENPDAIPGVDSEISDVPEIPEVSDEEIGTPPDSENEVKTDETIPSEVEIPDASDVSMENVDKDACTGVDGETEPYEISELLRATTKPGKWIQASDGRWWYKHNDGTYTKNGWEYINGKWYYFDSSGWMKTGWIKVNNVWYYLSSSGAMVTGWQKISNKWYYFNSSGAMKTGWLLLNGKWYYLNSSGAMVTGWVDVGVSKYYFNGNGDMNPYAVVAYKNNKYTGTSDGQRFISLLANTKYQTISRYIPASSVSKNNFYSTGEYIKYWASHGLTNGDVYGDANSVRFNVLSQSLKWSGNNLEFVFLATCSQLSGGLINKYANAMKGDKGVRAVAGYHKTAPSGMTGGDRDVVDRFMRYAKTGESVKSSWILANEESMIGGNCSVLAHGGVAQFSRFSGFPGATYSRPNGSNVFKYDVVVRQTPINLSDTSVGALNFKVDVEELANLKVPNYQLKKIDKLYTVNEAIDTIVLEDDTEICTLNGEIGDESVVYDENEAIIKAQTWVDNAFNEFDLSLLKNPSIKEVVKTEVTDNYEEGENGSTVAYIVSCNNEVDGYKIQGEGIKAFVDNSGVIYSSIDWNDYEKISSYGERTISNRIGYEESVSILEREIVSKTQSKSSLLTSTGERNTVVNAELIFSYDDESNLYIPVWHYEMEDGRGYDIKCDTGEITEL